MYSEPQKTSLYGVSIRRTVVKPTLPASDARGEIVLHLRPMRAFAMSLTRERARADDLVQETVLKAWANIDKFETGTNMRAWLFTIMRNTFYSERRRAAREIADYDGTLADRMAVGPDHNGRLALADFRRAFDTLPVVQREALILVGAEGFSYEETAVMCGCAIGTIKSRINRGRRRLAVLLGMEDGEQVGLADHATMAVINKNH